jgi:hypothetical protein
VKMATTGPVDREKMFQAGAAGNVEQLRLLLESGARVDDESRVRECFNVCVCGCVFCRVSGLHVRAGWNNCFDGGES